jgi:hypothetical protein
LHHAGRRAPSTLPVFGLTRCAWAQARQVTSSMEVSFSGLADAAKMLNVTRAKKCPWVVFLGYLFLCRR